MTNPIQTIEAIRAIFPKDRIELQTRWSSDPGQAIGEHYTLTIQTGCMDRFSARGDDLAALVRSATALAKEESPS